MKKFVSNLTLILVILSATWCTGEGKRSALQMMRQPKWKKTYLHGLYFLRPPDMEARETINFDSSVWKFSNKDLELTVDLGRYSSESPSNKRAPEYTESRTRISGKPVTIVFFHRSVGSPDLPYVAAAYFSNIGPKGIHLSFYARCASHEQQKAAKRIFLSIRFTNRHSDTTISPSVRRRSRARADL